MFSLVRNCHGCTFCISSSNEWELLLIHILVSIWCCAVDFNCSNRCVVTSHCCFNLQFSNDMMLSIFSYTYLPSVYLLSDMSVEIFCSFLNWVICFLVDFKSSLYILDTSPLSDTYFTNIFSSLWFAFSFS